MSDKFFVRNDRLYARRDEAGRFIPPQPVYTGEDSAEEALLKHARVAEGRPITLRPTRPPQDEEVPLAHLSWGEWSDPTIE